MGSVAEDVLRLRFTGRYVESMYRNDERIREFFIGRIGAIAALTRSASKDVNGSIGFKGIAEVAGTRSGEQAIEYNLQDPTAQALVLRENLTLAGEMREVADAAPGQFASIVGKSCLSRPPDVPIAFDFHAGCSAAEQPQFPELEQDRAMQEAALRLMNPGEEQMWLLTISDRAGTIRAAAVLHRHWINQNAFMSYSHMPWELFGVVRQRVAGVPVLAAVHILARLDLLEF